jgi:hypothetical protein
MRWGKWGEEKKKRKKEVGTPSRAKANNRIPFVHFS